MSGLMVLGLIFTLIQLYRYTDIHTSILDTILINIEMSDIIVNVSIFTIYLIRACSMFIRQCYQLCHKVNYVNIILEDQSRLGMVEDY